MASSAASVATAAAQAATAPVAAARTTVPTVELSSSTSHFVEEGDLIIVYLSHNRNPLPVVVHAGATHSNAFGTFPHSTCFLGKPFGSRVHSPKGRGFIHILRPTPELWTLSLPHRTQILYQTDIAFITQQLRLSPGARVIEAGTGSGSFTHALARTVGREHQVRRFQGTGSESVGRNDPRENVAAERVNALAALDDTRDDVPTDGRVFSYEFHAQRHAKAKVEFAAHGLSNIVRVTHRNVCKDGFALSEPRAGPSSEKLDGEKVAKGNNEVDTTSKNGTSSRTSYPIVEAVFLDLPAPWEAIPFVPAHLNPNRTTRICCFSPCIEQVLKTVQALNAHGFSDVQTWECLMREMESTPLAKVTKDEPLVQPEDEAASDDDNANEEDNAQDDDGDSEQDGQPANRRNGKSKGGSASKLGKRKRDGADSNARSDMSAAQSASHKSRWGLERPRDVGTIIQRIHEVEERKEARRLAQVASARAERERRNALKAASEGAAGPTASNVEAVDEAEVAEEDDNVLMNVANNEEEGDDPSRKDINGEAAPPSRVAPSSHQATPSIPRLFEPASVYGRVLPEMRGHTSYLTFGTMLARVAGIRVGPTGTVATTTSTTAEAAPTASSATSS